ncbi:MAG: hypothetical protein V1844_08760 [Pseudomonadota bacterium]
MIVGTMFPLVIMMMINWGRPAVCMVVIVLMGMIVAMVMDVFVAVFHVRVSMLMGVLMCMSMVVQMIVFVFSFHLSILLLLRVVVAFQVFPITVCFKYFGGICQRINRLTRNFGTRFKSQYRFNFPE